MSNLLFCHSDFRKPSAAEASKCVYKWERAKVMGKVVPDFKEEQRFIHVTMNTSYFSLNLFILHQFRNELSAYINHARCLLPGDLTSTHAVIWKNPKVRTRSSRDSNQGPLV